MILCISQSCTLTATFSEELAAWGEAGWAAVELWLTKLETHLETASVADTRNQLADRIEHYAHETPLERVFVRLFCSLSMVASRFNLVHARDGSIMIDLP